MVIKNARVENHFFPVNLEVKFSRANANADIGSPSNEAPLTI